ncbi:unnamed protein product [Closterium sp. NIES-53]
MLVQAQSRQTAAAATALIAAATAPTAAATAPTEATTPAATAPTAAATAPTAAAAASLLHQQHLEVEMECQWGSWHCCCCCGHSPASGNYSALLEADA